MTSTFQEYKNRRAERLSQGQDLEKMRLGQAACDIVICPSDPEIRFAIVPLLEGEYRRALEVAEKLPVSEGPAGAVVREQVQKEMVLYFAAREIRDLTQHFFDSEADIMDLAKPDLDHAWDVYLEMTATISPSLLGMTEADFDGLKKALPRIQWSELSGTQWYAAQRFLGSIQPHLLTASLSGSSSTES